MDIFSLDFLGVHKACSKAMVYVSVRGPAHRWIVYSYHPLPSVIGDFAINCQFSMEFLLVLWSLRFLLLSSAARHDPAGCTAHVPSA